MSRAGEILEWVASMEEEETRKRGRVGRTLAKVGAGAAAAGAAAYGTHAYFQRHPKQWKALKKGVEKGYRGAKGAVGL